MVQTPAWSVADWLRRAAPAASVVVALSFFAATGTAVSAEVPDGAWFIDGSGAAIQIFDCSDRLCGRIIWLQIARDAARQLARDNKNPDIRHSDRACCVA